MLVPAKELDRAKGRLQSLLSPQERRLLALATLGTVLAACDGVGLPVTVLSRDRAVADALPPGVALMGEDAALDGLNAQLERAVALLGADDLLVLHADLPLATSDAVNDLLAAGEAAESVVLVGSRDGGTTAMRLRPPGRFALQYGRRSFERHTAAAREAGLRVIPVDIPALAFDIDTVDDLHTLLESREGRATPAGQLLHALAIPERLSTSQGE